MVRLTLLHAKHEGYVSNHTKIFEDDTPSLSPPEEQTPEVAPCKLLLEDLQVERCGKLCKSNSFNQGQYYDSIISYGK